MASGVWIPMKKKLTKRKQMISCVLCQWGCKFYSKEASNKGNLFL